MADLRDRTTLRVRPETAIHEPHMWVYFIQAGPRGPIKIGAARDVRKRLLNLQSGHYETLHVIATLADHGPAGSLEGRLHNRFRSAWIRGEWFRSDDTDLCAFIGDLLNDNPPEWVTQPPATSDVPAYCARCPWRIERSRAFRGAVLCKACAEADQQSHIQNRLQEML